MCMFANIVYDSSFFSLLLKVRSGVKRTPFLAFSTIFDQRVDLHTFLYALNIKREKKSVSKDTFTKDYRNSNFQACKGCCYSHLSQGVNFTNKGCSFVINRASRNYVDNQRGRKGKPNVNVGKKAGST